MQGGRLKFWGWGYEDQQPPHEEVQALAQRREPISGSSRPTSERPVELARTRSCRARGSSRRGAGRDLPHGRRTSAPRTPTARPTATSCAPSAAASTTRRTWWPTRATRPSSSALLDWCERPARRRSRSAAGRAWSAASRPRSARLRRRGHDRPAPDRPGARGRPGLAGGAHPGGRHGPGLEDQLREHGLTLRHYPQSFEYSTLGGWIATRAGGHFATLGTHIDDHVESVRALTPRGVWESRACPAPAPGRARTGC